MTTAYRPQADIQTERQNLVLEDALRYIVSYDGTDWSEHLGIIEYAHAILVSSATGYSPFELDTRRKLTNPISTDLPTSVPKLEYTERFLDERKKLVDIARKQIISAQERMKKYYDKKK